MRSGVGGALFDGAGEGEDGEDEDGDGGGDSKGGGGGDADDDFGASPQRARLAAARAQDRALQTL
jgi:hypothetical protein